MTELRHDWTDDEVLALFEQPFMDLLFQAQTCHRETFDPNQVQISTLLSIKTGACPEDCGYCSQSGHHQTFVEKEKLMSVDEVVACAKEAKAKGATRFCMGGAWRSPPDKAMPVMIDMIEAVRALGLETCLTAGMLNDEQTQQLKAAGLDYYNHNLDTSPEYYSTVTSTRTYEDRLETLARVRECGINVCCGGIIGMGESRIDRVRLLLQLANLPEHPQSVPINQLIAVPGTPLGKSPPLEGLEFVRTIAVARLMMPKSMVRLSAGRETMSEELQALCFAAGANSIFYGEKLLTAGNPAPIEDVNLFSKLGIIPMRESAI